MNPPPDRRQPWWDDQAGPVTRPYAIVDGRTRPGHDLDLITLVTTTGAASPQLRPDHDRALALCPTPTSVAEIAAGLARPVVIAKILISDLLDCGAVRVHAPRPATAAGDHNVLEAVLRGLQRL